MNASKVSGRQLIQFSNTVTQPNASLLMLRQFTVIGAASAHITKPGAQLRFDTVLPAAALLLPLLHQ